jgi:NDP-sugar pyrophosphorylase family protein
MGHSLAGVVLAAGAGRRLRPLTRLRAKALCPVAGRPLVDLAIERLEGAADGVAVNVHHGRAELEAHLRRRVHLSVEEPVALGTAGALAQLRPWIDRRAVLLTNADAWIAPDLTAFVSGWDGERVRLLCVRDPARGDFDDLRYCGLALLPYDSIEPLPLEPSGLYEASWRALWRLGRLDLVVHDGPFVDCGTPADYLVANLAANGGSSVVGPGAVVGDGATVRQSVVWPGSEVQPGEVLERAIRAEHLTILLR